MTTWSDVNWSLVPTPFVAPAVEPVTLAEAKRQTGLDSSEGEPAPTLITAALINPAVAGNVDNGAHRYLATFVTADGETEAGAISAVVTVADKTVNGKVSLTAIPLGGSAVTSRKIYRTAAAGSTYLLLTTLADNTTLVYTDNTADSGLGAQAPTTNTTVDPYLSSLIVTARELTEEYTRRAWITQTRDLAMDCFPDACESIRVPRVPLISVTHISYVDVDGVTRYWTSDLTVTGTAQYDVDTAGGRIKPKYNTVYPAIRPQMNAITVRFVCGYGTAASSVPARAKQAQKLLISHWNEHREAVTAVAFTDLPMGVASLLEQLGT